METNPKTQIPVAQQKVLELLNKRENKTALLWLKDKEPLVRAIAGAMVRGEFPFDKIQHVMGKMEEMFLAPKEFQIHEVSINIIFNSKKILSIIKLYNLIRLGLNNPETPYEIAPIIKGNMLKGGVVTENSHGNEMVEYSEDNKIWNDIIPPRLLDDCYFDQIMQNLSGEDVVDIIKRMAVADLSKYKRS